VAAPESEDGAGPVLLYERVDTRAASTADGWFVGGSASIPAVAYVPPHPQIGLAIGQRSLTPQSELRFVVTFSSPVHSFTRTALDIEVSATDGSNTGGVARHLTQVDPLPSHDGVASNCGMQFRVTLAAGTCDAVAGCRVTVSIPEFAAGVVPACAASSVPLEGGDDEFGAVAEVTYDLVPPQVKVLRVLPKRLASTTLQVGLGCTEATCEYSYSLDDSPWHPVTAADSDSGDVGGVAYDTVATIVSGPGVVTPNASGTFVLGVFRGAASPLVNRSVTLTDTAAHAVSNVSFLVSLDGSPAELVHSPVVTVDNLEPGRHWLAVRVTSDSASSALPTTYQWLVQPSPAATGGGAVSMEHPPALRQCTQNASTLVAAGGASSGAPLVSWNDTTIPGPDVAVFVPSEGSSLAATCAAFGSKACSFQYRLCAPPASVDATSCSSCPPACSLINNAPHDGFISRSAATPCGWSVPSVLPALFLPWPSPSIDTSTCPNASAVQLRVVFPDGGVGSSATFPLGHAATTPLPEVTLTRTPPPVAPVQLQTLPWRWEVHWSLPVTPAVRAGGLVLEYAVVASNASASSGCVLSALNDTATAATSDATDGAVHWSSSLMHGGVNVPSVLTTILSLEQTTQKEDGESSAPAMQQAVHEVLLTDPTDSGVASNLTTSAVCNGGGRRLNQSSDPGSFVAARVGELSDPSSWLWSRVDVPRPATTHTTLVSGRFAVPTAVSTTCVAGGLNRTLVVRVVAPAACPEAASCVSAPMSSCCRTAVVGSPALVSWLELPEVDTSTTALPVHLTQPLTRYTPLLIAYPPAHHTWQGEEGDKFSWTLPCASCASEYRVGVLVQDGTGVEVAAEWEWTIPWTHASGSHTVSIVVPHASAGYGPPENCPGDGEGEVNMRLEFRTLVPSTTGADPAANTWVRDAVQSYEWTKTGVPCETALTVEEVTSSLPPAAVSATGTARVVLSQHRASFVWRLVQPSPEVLIEVSVCVVTPAHAHGVELSPRGDLDPWHPQWLPLPCGVGVEADGEGREPTPSSHQVWTPTPFIQLRPLAPNATYAVFARARHVGGWTGAGIGSSGSGSGSGGRGAGVPYLRTIWEVVDAVVTLVDHPALVSPQFTARFSFALSSSTLQARANSQPWALWLEYKLQEEEQAGAEAGAAEGETKTDSGATALPTTTTTPGSHPGPALHALDWVRAPSLGEHLVVGPLPPFTPFVLRVRVRAPPCVACWHPSVEAAAAQLGVASYVGPETRWAWRVSPAANASLRLEQLPQGPHSLRLRARDAAGNMQRPATHYFTRFTVDTVPPNASAVELLYPPVTIGEGSGGTVPADNTANAVSAWVPSPLVDNGATTGAAFLATTAFASNTTTVRWAIEASDVMGATGSTWEACDTCSVRLFLVGPVQHGAELAPNVPVDASTWSFVSLEGEDGASGGVPVLSPSIPGVAVDVVDEPGRAGVIVTVTRDGSGWYALFAAGEDAAGNMQGSKTWVRQAWRIDRSPPALAVFSLSQDAPRGVTSPLTQDIGTAAAVDETSGGDGPTVVTNRTSVVVRLASVDADVVRFHVVARPVPSPYLHNGGALPDGADTRPPLSFHAAAWFIDDNDDVATYDEWVAEAGTGDVVVAAEVEVVGLDHGVYTLSAQAVDELGNIGHLATPGSGAAVTSGGDGLGAASDGDEDAEVPAVVWQLRVDRVAPTSAVPVVVRNPVNMSSVVVDLSAAGSTEPLRGFHVKVWNATATEGPPTPLLDRSAFVAVTPPTVRLPAHDAAYHTASYTLFGLTTGTFLVTAQAQDVAGNLDVALLDHNATTAGAGAGAGASLALTVDLVPPRSVVEAAPRTFSNVSHAQFTFVEAGGQRGCSFRVTIVDAAGRVWSATGTTEVGGEAGGGGVSAAGVDVDVAGPLAQGLARATVVAQDPSGNEEMGGALVTNLTALAGLPPEVWGETPIDLGPLVYAEWTVDTLPPSGTLLPPAAWVRSSFAAAPGWYTQARAWNATVGCVDATTSCTLSIVLRGTSTTSNLGDGDGDGATTVVVVAASWDPVLQGPLVAISAPVEGPHELLATAVDDAGNRAAVAVLEWVVDTTPPRVAVRLWTTTDGDPRVVLPATTLEGAADSAMAFASHEPAHPPVVCCTTSVADATAVRDTTVVVAAACSDASGSECRLTAHLAFTPATYVDAGCVAGDGISGGGSNPLFDALPDAPLTRRSNGTDMAPVPVVVAVPAATGASDPGLNPVLVDLVLSNHSTAPVRTQAGAVQATRLPDGAFTLLVTGADAAGNTWTTRVEWSVDTVPPRAPTLVHDLPDTFTTPSTSLGVTAVLLGESSPGMLTAGQVWYSLDDSSAAPVPAQHVTLTGAAASVAIRAELALGNTVGSLTGNIPLLDGGHRLQVWVVDAAGNVGDVADLRWDVQSRGPCTRLLRAPAARSGHALARFVFRATLPHDSNDGCDVSLRKQGGVEGVTFEVQLDPPEWIVVCAPNAPGVFTPPSADDPFGICEYEHQLPTVGRTYLMAIRAVNGLGIPSIEPATHTWRFEHCEEQQFAVMNDTTGALDCLACPPGADCPAGLVEQTEVQATEGWWAPSSISNSGSDGAGSQASASGVSTPSTAALRFYKCPIEDACLGKTVDSNGTVIPARCAPGYRGMLCALCDDGYFRQFGKCAACPQSREGVWVLTLAISAAVLLVAFILYLTRDALPMDIAGIVITFCQVCCAVRCVCVRVCVCACVGCVPCFVHVVDTVPFVPSCGCCGADPGFGELVHVHSLANPVLGVPQHPESRVVGHSHPDTHRLCGADDLL